MEKNFFFQSIKFQGDWSLKFCKTVVSITNFEASGTELRFEMNVSNFVIYLPQFNKLLTNYKSRSLRKP